jgi:hypothetical protein
MVIRNRATNPPLLTPVLRLPKRPATTWPALLLTLALLFALSLAGCIENGPQEQDGQNGDNPDDPDPTKTIPEPIVFQGEAVAINPLHSVFCLNQGVDGDFHEIEENVDGWHYSLEPADSFTAYWFDADFEYISGGESQGPVPTGAAYVEICNTEETGPTTYTLIIHHPQYESEE